jgi:Protein of unknown function DUF262
MKLEQEVKTGRQEIHTDAYPMSIGELVNLYRDRELDIHPEFQRQFRWADYQKSKLIESILLGIPLPSLFVAQRDDGVWDVVDGLQRISTILEFMGELKDSEGLSVPPLLLQSTQYLPSLQGMSWNGVGGTQAMSSELRLAFKREKVDVKIIKKESDKMAKYELFQRLNTGGSKLSEQEVRNCLLIMLRREAYAWLAQLSANSDFKGCLALSDRQIEEDFHLELALRYFIATKYSEGEGANHPDVGPYITERMKELLLDPEFDFNAEGKLFAAVFGLLNQELGDGAFKRYSVAKDLHSGPFLVSLFECLSAGVSVALQGRGETHARQRLKEVAPILADHPKYKKATAHGVRGIIRFPKLVELAQELFA